MTVPKRKADLKVVILGAMDVGKTALIHRYIEGTFKEMQNTIGASFSLKQYGNYNVAIWDTAGEERFTGLSSFYCRGAGAAILAFDLNDADSYHALRTRFLPLLSAAEDDCLQLVVGTKSDLLNPSATRCVTQQELLVFARKINTEKLDSVPYFETSSLTGQNVERVFDYIFKHKLPDNGIPAKSSGSTVDLETKENKVQPSSCKC